MTNYLRRPSVRQMQDISRNDEKFDRLLERLNNLHKEVAMSVDQREMSDGLTELIARAEAEANNTRLCIDRLKSTSDQLNQQMDKLSPVLSGVGPLLEKLERLTQMDRLLDQFETIKQINSTLETNLVNSRNAKDSEIRVIAITNAFNKLINQYKALSEKRNQEMKRYLLQIIEYWKRVLLERFETKFIETFEAIDWPKTSDDCKPQPNPDSLNAFISYFKVLLTIDIDNELAADVTDHSNRNRLSYNIVLPISLMLRPIKKRFQYHFMEAKSKLNRPEKVISVSHCININEGYLNRFFLSQSGTCRRLFSGFATTKSSCTSLLTLY